MPLAVVMEDPDRVDLKTCPGGFVMVQRMTFGEKLQRRMYTSKMEMDMERGSRKARSTIDIFKKETEFYDFAHCITDHNLTKLVNAAGQPCKPNDPEAHEVPLDFKKPADVELLAGRIAEEIGREIDKRNNFEEDEDLGNSNGESVLSS